MSCSHVALMALLGSLHLIADAGEYPRGPVPVGGEVFRCSFDGSGTAEVGAGIRKMALRYSRYQCNEGWKFSYVDGRFGKAVDVHPDRQPVASSGRRLGRDEWSNRVSGRRGVGRNSQDINTGRLSVGGPVGIYGMYS